MTDEVNEDAKALYKVKCLFTNLFIAVVIKSTKLELYIICIDEFMQFYWIFELNSTHFSHL